MTGKTPANYNLEGVGHVYAWGESENPTVILLHGFMQTGKSWQPIANKLAEDHFVLAPDLLGHGQTPYVPGSPLTFESYTEQIRQLVLWCREQKKGPRAKGESAGKNLGTESTAKDAESFASFAMPEKVDLVGYSFGGRVASVFCIEHPEMVGSLILESAGLGPQDEAERAQRAEKTANMVAQLDKSIEANPAAPLESFVDWWENLPLFATQHALEASVQTSIRQERLANNPQALRSNLLQAGQHKMPNVRPALSNVNKPILYVVGERDVAYTKVAQSLMRAWAENHESALLERGFVQVSVIPQVGHNAHLEAPEEFGLLVQRFLAQRPCSCATC